jgi:aspartyl-tRNA synthetase
LSPHKKIVVNFKRLKHREAIDLYGSDKPDLRFDMQLVDLTHDLADSGFAVFKDTVMGGGTIKAMKFADKILTRKEADQLTEQVKKN